MSKEQKEMKTSVSAYVSNSHAIGNLFSIILKAKFEICDRPLKWEAFLDITERMPLFEEPGDFERTWRMIQAIQECMIFNDEEVKE